METADVISSGRLIFTSGGIQPSEVINIKIKKKNDKAVYHLSNVFKVISLYHVISLYYKCM